MHQVLSTSELLDAIFGFLEPPENAINALICKKWSDVALDLLWRDVDYFSRLMELLAPLTFEWSKPDNCFKYEFTRSPESADWKRFEKYAVRVRKLNYVMPKRAIVSRNSFYDIARTRTYHDILPNLHTLEWQGPILDSVMFMHGGVKKFIINLLEGDLPIFRSFFSEVISRMPNVTFLEFCSSLPVHGIERNIAYLLSNVPKLHTITLPQYYLTSKLTETLSRLPHLRVIQMLSPLEGAGEISDIIPFEPTLTEGAFPALDDLSFSATFRDAANFLSRPSPSTNLSELLIASASIEGPASIKNLLTLISENCQLLKVLLVREAMTPFTSEPDDTFRITFDNLKPILKLTNIVKLEISHQYPLALTQDDVETIASTWPALELLCLSPDPVHFQKPTLTLDALNPFAQRCQNLRELSLLIDASAKSVLPPSASFIPFKRLSVLRMGLSTIDGEPSEVALRLSLVVPPGCELWYGDNWSTEVVANNPGLALASAKTCDKWKKVEDLLPVLMKARIEERERTKDMEKELRNLRMKQGL